LTERDDEATHPAAEIEHTPPGHWATKILDLAQPIRLITLLPEAALAPLREVSPPAHVRRPAIDESFQRGFVARLRVLNSPLITRCCCHHRP
jgi:hypothetical protein